MEVITIDGQQFVKASAAARQAGYTPDYVGQLARSGAVPARLVGRTWYVDNNALRTHRVEKKRFAREKAREQVKKAIEERNNALKDPLSTLKDSRKGKYDADEKDLIPVVQKQKNTATSGGKSEVGTPNEPSLQQETALEYNHIRITESQVPLSSPYNKVFPLKSRHPVVLPRKRALSGAVTQVEDKERSKKISEHQQPKSLRSSSRNLGRGVSVFLVSLLVGVLLAALEVRHMYELRGGTSIAKVEYVINIGGIFSKVGL